MEGSGPKQERETVINFNDNEDTCSLWTASETVYRRLLKRLGRAYLTEDGERHAVFVFPKKLLILPRVKVKRLATPEQRAQSAINFGKRRVIRGRNDQSGGVLT